jgi:Ner family transcriptional regulator
MILEKPLKGWHREDVKALLRKKFGPISALEKAWGYGAGMISCVLRNPRRSAPLAKKIAASINKPPHELWPAVWTADGSFIPRPRKPRVASHPKFRTNKNGKL